MCMKWLNIKRTIMFALCGMMAASTCAATRKIEEIGTITHIVGLCQEDNALKRVNNGLPTDSVIKNIPDSLRNEIKLEKRRERYMRLAAPYTTQAFSAPL